MTQILHIPKIIFGVSRTYYKTPLLRLLDTKIRTLLDRGTVSDVDGNVDVDLHPSCITTRKKVPYVIWKVMV
jgi:hypothetical protein